jgi:hypothetical protein
VGAPEHRYLIRDRESKDDGPVAQKGLWLSGIPTATEAGPRLDAQITARTCAGMYVLMGFRTVQHRTPSRHVNGVQKGERTCVPE